MSDFIGYLAATLTTVAFIPQAYQVYKTREVKDLSLSLFIIFSLGVFMWLVYGLLMDNMPIIIANTITFILASYILYMKVKIDILGRQD